ncbi:MAG TPA: RNA 2',3'-cyclic phosphodiesterase [Sporichthyaceae bacterium]|jgi:2'-5' RNA ligase|nr:RNA 2',3'-cyclic phosphodiesterase [Sporichthyaceae bacterium]
MFVALRPPPAALAELRAAVAGLLPFAPDGLRWTVAEQWHLTSCFLAEVPDPVVEDLIRRLRRAATAVEPLTLRLRGGGRFGDRVLWVGLDGDTAALRVLATKVRYAALGAELDVEIRRFRPHLTLARAGRPVAMAQVAERLHEFAGSPWRAVSMELVHSTLGAGPGGTPRHRTVAELILGRR